MENLVGILALWRTNYIYIYLCNFVKRIVSSTSIRDKIAIETNTTSCTEEAQATAATIGRYLLSTVGANCPVVAPATLCALVTNPPYLVGVILTTRGMLPVIMTILVVCTGMRIVPL
jgi:hypothetical protein